jgi:DNA-binding PadR family transcriptional regulator
MLEHILLGLLMEGSLSGYDMKKTIDSTVGLFYKASFGSLYPALQRLTDKHHVSVKEIEDSKNKKIYTLLPSGRAVFLQWLAEPLPLSRNEHLLKIFFYDYLDEPTRESNLANYIYNLDQEVNRLKAVQQLVSTELAQLENPQQHYYRVSVLSYGLHHFRMEKAWVQTIKERIEFTDESFI